jgi:hypothetical protein
MKKTFLFTLITATFLLFSSAGCKKEGFEIPVTNKPNLTIENVAGPDIEECGGFKWDVKFNLNEASKAGGWIIQKITYKRNVISCPNVPFLNDDITYWEAWRVAAGAKGDSDRLAGAFNYDDRYSSPNFPNTKGNTTVTGEVRFFEGINLPAGFVKNNNKTYAGGLPATTDKPDFWDSKDAADHNLDFVWNCCTNPGTKSLKTTAGPKKTTIFIPLDLSKLDEIGKKIAELFSWTNGYYTSASAELLNIARQVQNTTTPSSLRNSLLVYENACRGTTDYVEHMSKVYLLLRVLYQLPQEMISSNAKTFGGWIHPSVGKNYFNMSWPVAVTQSASVITINVDNYQGFLGRGYDAAGELDYFNNNFPKRNLY